MQIYFLGTQRQLRFLKGLPVSQSIIIFLSMVSEAFSLTLAFANYVEVILLLSQIHWSDTRCVLFYWDPNELVSLSSLLRFSVALLQEIDPTFSGTREYKLLAVRILIYPLFLILLLCMPALNITFSLVRALNFKLFSQNWSSNSRMFPMELIQSGIFISGSCCINGWRRYCQIHWCHQRIW